MTFEKANDNDAQHSLACPDRIRKVYHKPTITQLDALVIETGDTNVPESVNGLMES